MSTANDLGISPAPWKCDDNRAGHEGLVKVFDAQDKPIVYFGDMEDCDWSSIAEGRLFAAAPDLYDALTALCDALDDAITTNAKAVAVAVIEARAALRKAKEG